MNVGDLNNLIIILMNKKNYSIRTIVLALLGALSWFPANVAQAANPFLPLWEYIPDGEPYVFEDPDHPGKYRVYVYGSHDSMKTEYCGREQVVWSAPVDDLNNWRYDGIIFESKTDARGEWLSTGGVGDVLYAPDVVEVKDKNGKKTYYLYPNNQAGGRNGMVAKADRPDGPFRVCNWSKQSPKVTDGILAFDPAVLVDDDGRVYGYWGFEESWGAELDPATMATVKPGTQAVKDMVSNYKQDGVFRFFEASSIRKIKDKYVFIYSRWTAEGEFGFPGSNYTLAYAYSDNPLGPFTYGGTLIDGRGRDVDADGKPILTATPGGNTHGSIVEINGRWYVFYHRQCGTNEFARQAMVAPIEVKVTEGAGGKVEITEGEYTSEGFETDGLNPYKRYSAGIACYYTGPRPAYQKWPNFYFSGSYVQPTYGDATNFDDPYNLRVNSNPVVNNTAGSIVGYKYFNFDLLDPDKDVELLLSLKPLGVEGTIDVMVGSPWTSRGGVKVGMLSLSKDAPQQITEMRISVSKAKEFKGKQALYFVFSSPTADRSLCELHNLVFVKR